jgi:hypothetical protein
MSTTHRLKTRIGKTQASDREAYPREVKVRHQGQAHRKTSTQIPTHLSHMRGGKPEPVRHRRSRNHRTTLAAPLEQAPAKDSRHEHPQTPLSQFAPTLLIDGYSTTLSLCTEDIRFCTQRAVLVLA